MEAINPEQKNILRYHEEWTDELSLMINIVQISQRSLRREKEIGILELLEFELEKVNDALMRNDADLRQVCSICGKEIESQRLKRLVNTTICARCAHSYDKNYRVHNEEPPAPGMMSDMGESFQVAGYELYEE